MLPRILRVTRAKNIQKAAGRKEKGTVPKRNSESAASYKPKIPSEVQSLNVRARKLLGRAGAAQIRAAGNNQVPASEKLNGITKSPESIIFEGYRASRLQGNGVLKMRGSGKKHGKSSARSKEFKAKGRKKG
jgi:nucleolar protein 12